MAYPQNQCFQTSSQYETIIPFRKKLANVEGRRDSALSGRIGNGKIKPEQWGETSASKVLHKIITESLVSGHTGRSHIVYNGGSPGRCIELAPRPFQDRIEYIRTANYRIQRGTAATNNNASGGYIPRIHVNRFSGSFKWCIILRWWREKSGGKSWKCFVFLRHYQNCMKPLTAIDSI